MRRFWRSRWLHWGLWLVLIFGLSSVPDLTPPGPSVPGIDKIFHAGEYALLGALWVRAWGVRRRGFWLGAALGLAVGLLDELYQGTVPGREMDALDALADTMGAALGGSAWAWWARRHGGATASTSAIQQDERP